MPLGKSFLLAHVTERFMASNLFEVVNPKMFTVFSREDRRSNFDLLSHLFEFFSLRQIALKEEVVDDLTDYIRNREFSEFDDDEGNSIADRTAKEKASLKMRQFKRYGWLEEDTTEGFSTTLSLNEHAISILECFRSIVDKWSRPLEYTGYFYIVYDLLNNFEYGKSKAILEQVIKNTKELFNSLQGLSSSIKHFIEDLINKEDITPEKVLESLLYKYQDQVMMTVFNNLKGRDNPSRFTSEIIDKLKELRFNSFNRVVDHYVKSAYPSGFSNDDYLEIENDLATQLDLVISRFESVGDFIALIDKRNTKFHDTALAKIRFLMNSRRDVTGLLTQALRALKNADPNAEYGDIIPLEATNNVDDHSLYARSFNKEKATIIRSDLPVASEEEIEAAKKRLFEEESFSRQKINSFALSCLGERKIMSSSEITIEKMEDLVMVMMIQLYAYYEEMDYEIVLEEGYYATFGYRLRRFVLKRKERKKK